MSLEDRIRAYAGAAPAGLTDEAWEEMVTAGVLALVDADGRPDNDVTPERYAVAVLRAAVPAAVVAARAAVSGEIAAHLDAAGHNAKAYHYKAAMAKAAGIARAAGGVR